MLLYVIIVSFFGGHLEHCEKKTHVKDNTTKGPSKNNTYKAFI